MPTLNTLPILNQFNTTIKLYQKDFTIDTLLNSPGMYMAETDVAAEDRIYQLDQNGLFIQFIRPKFEGNLVIFSVLPLFNDNQQNMRNFTLIANFQKPTQNLVTSDGSLSNYAAVLAMSIGNSIGGKLYGATSQFLSGGGQRLNTPGLGLPPRQPIPRTYSDQVSDSSNPSVFTLILNVQQSGHPNAITLNGTAELYVGTDLADRTIFSLDDKISKHDRITSFRVGLGTTGKYGDLSQNIPAVGYDYRVSLNILNFEVWIPEGGPKWVYPEHTDIPERFPRGHTEPQRFPPDDWEHF